jgi:hypothetical protein
MISEHEGHADLGTVLPRDCAAVTVDAVGRFGFLLPSLPPDEDVPREIMLLAAVLARSSDQDWIDEMIRWFSEQARA